MDVISIAHRNENTNNAQRCHKAILLNQCNWIYITTFHLNFRSKNGSYGIPYNFTIKYSNFMSELVIKCIVKFAVNFIICAKQPKYLLLLTGL